MSEPKKPDETIVAWAVRHGPGGILVLERLRVPLKAVERFRAMPPEQNSKAIIAAKIDRDLCSDAFTSGKMWGEQVVKFT